MSKHLNVFNNNVLIGTLREESGRLIFRYERLWLESSSAEPLSEYLPLQERDMSGLNVESFFGNLLPEGAVLQMISKWTHISPDNIFGLLDKFGGDLLGAFSVLPADVSPGDLRYLEVTKEHLREWIETRSKPLTLHAKDARISLSGAQDKTSLLVRDGKLFIPLGDAPSTHILKPRIADRLGVEHSAANETFVMMLGKAVGLGVANIEYRDDLLSVLVERYDREITERGVEKLHQLDFCQLLNIPSSKKYEAEGGPSLRDCFEVVRTHTSEPALQTKRLLKWVIFNAAAGNMDGHAKNLSILIRGGKQELAPFYDLLCTSIYESTSQRLAFKIGGENRPRLLMKRHWDRLAKEVSMKPVFIKKIVLETTKQIETRISGVLGNIMPLSDSKEKAFLERVARKIISNTRTLRNNFAKETTESLQKFV